MKLLLTLIIALMAFSSTCYAVEDDGEGNILQSKTLTLDGDDTPPPPPKVIVKERVVHQCPTGYSWTPEVRKCLDADGNEFAPVRKQAPKPQMAAPAYGVDERHVFPNAQVRIRVGQCIMSGESVTCDFRVINVGEYDSISAGDPTIIDNTGMTYRTGGNYMRLQPGGSDVFNFRFDYVNRSAESLKFSAKLNRRNQSDLLVFMMPIVK